MGDLDPRRGAGTIGQQGSGQDTPLDDSAALAADSGLDAESAALLADLTAAIGELDPVPPALVDAAKESWTWRTIDAELAALVNDTSASPSATRAGGDAPRTLTFEAGSTAVVLEVTVIGRARRLLGQIVRPRRTEVEVRHSGGSVSVTTDEMGRFSVDEVPAGPLSLVCRFLDSVSRPIATSWVAV